MSSFGGREDLMLVSVPAHQHETELHSLTTYLPFMVWILSWAPQPLFSACILINLWIWPQFFIHWWRSKDIKGNFATPWTLLGMECQSYRYCFSKETARLLSKLATSIIVASYFSYPLIWFSAFWGCSLSVYMVATHKKSLGGCEYPHEKINRCLTDINRCLIDIFKN